MLLLLAVVPTFLWLLESQNGRSALILSDKTGGPDLWPFLHRKFRTVIETPLPDDPSVPPGKRDVLLVSSIGSETGGDDDARRAADLIRDAALDSGVTFFDGLSLSEDHNLMFRSIIEQYLGIRSSRWSVLYVRGKTEIEQLDPLMKKRLAEEGLSISANRPVLLFSNEDGRVELFNSDSDFSGKVPFGSTENSGAELYGWLPVYLAGGGDRSKGNYRFSFDRERAEKDCPVGIAFQSPIRLQKNIGSGRQVVLRSASSRWFCPYGESRQIPQGVVFLSHGSVSPR